MGFAQERESERDTPRKFQHAQRALKHYVLYRAAAPKGKCSFAYWSRCAKARNTDMSIRHIPAHALQRIDTPLSGAILTNVTRVGWVGEMGAVNGGLVRRIEQIPRLPRRTSR